MWIRKGIKMGMMVISQKLLEHIFLPYFVKDICKMIWIVSIQSLNYYSYKRYGLDIYLYHTDKHRFYLYANTF